MSERTITFQWGGISRRVPVKIGLAVEVEDALGVGCIAIVRALGRGELRFMQSAQIVECALRSAGQLDAARHLEHAHAAGVIKCNTIAAQIIGALLAEPPGNAAAVAGEKPAAA